MLHVGGLTSLLKEGSKHLSGVQEAVVRNIEAVKEFILIVRSSMGPNGGKIHLLYALEAHCFTTSRDEQDGG